MPEPIPSGETSAFFNPVGIGSLAIACYPKIFYISEGYISGLQLFNYSKIGKEERNISFEALDKIATLQAQDANTQTSASILRQVHEFLMSYLREIRG